MPGSVPEDAPGPGGVDPGSPFTLPGFFAALGEGALYGIACGSCEARLVPPRPACYVCGSRDVRLEEQPREGVVVTYTEVVRPPSAFESLAPYTVAVVELGSGARLTGRVDAAYEEVEIGSPVVVGVEEPDPDAPWVRAHERAWPVHVFRLA